MLSGLYYSLRRESYPSVVVQSMVSRWNTTWLNLTDSLGSLIGLRIRVAAAAVRRYIHHVPGISKHHSDVSAVYATNNEDTANIHIFDLS